MTLCIIQARLGSTRLPRKALMEINGKPMIQHVIERAKQIASVPYVVLAVPADDREVFDGLDLCPVYGFEGLAPEDVLTRFARIVDRYPNSHEIIRLTGDCPLLNPRIAEQVLALYQSDQSVEYASNIAPGYVDGEDVEVFSRSALEWAHRDAHDPYDREHVTPWMRRHVKCATWTPAKTSVDTLEDLERVRAMVAA